MPDHADGVLILAKERMRAAKESRHAAKERRHAAKERMHAACSNACLNDWQLTMG